MAEYIGLNKEGIKPITDAINNYKKAVKKVDFEVTKSQIKVFAKGSSSVNAITAMIDAANVNIDTMFKKKLDPFVQRINSLANQYSKNDSEQSSTMKTTTNKILKS